MFRIDKDPAATKDWRWNWRRWLEVRDEDAISGVNFTVPAPLVKVAQDFTTTTATVMISGGVLHATYDIVCTITTDAGRIQPSTAKLTIRTE